MKKPLLLDCRAGWTIKDHAVSGWRQNSLHFDDCFHPGSKEPNEAMTKAAAEKHPATNLCIFDFEHWKLPDEIGKFIQVVDWWREIRPEIRIGYYGIIPIMGYWPTYHGGDKEAAWKHENAVLGRSRDADGLFSSRGLVDVVDFIAPCLYTFYAKHDGGPWWDHEAIWFDKFAPKMIEAARVYQKQVYPFLWMRIQREDGDFTHTVPSEHFKKQIQFCIDNADGVCIWDWADEKTGSDVLKSTNEVLREFI